MEWWKKNWRSAWLPAALIILITLIAYLPALSAGFNWDDDDHLTNNPCIVGPLGLKEIWTTKAARICPLVLTSFWGQHALWGLHPLPYHLVNILLHGVGAAVLWRALLSLKMRGAWLGAALWALHPVQVESVAWITEMKNTQSGLFFVLAVWLFVKSKTAERMEDRPSAHRYYILTLLCGALAMASKSSTVILPVVLALCAWWLDRQWRARDLIRLTPLMFMSAATGCLSMWTQKLEGASGPEWMGSWAERIIVAGKAIWFYLGKLLWPEPLIFIYPRWQIDSSRPASYLPVLAVVVLLLVLWRNRHRWARAGFFTFTYFIVALFPVLGLFNHYFLRYSFVGDHFQYLASMGPLAFAASAIVTGLDRFEKNHWRLRPAFCGTLLLTLGILTWRQTAIYRNPETLWRATIAQNPTAWMAQSNLGRLLLQKNELDEAIPHFEKAVEARPDHAETQYNLGNALLQKGLMEEAAIHFQKVLELWPGNAEARNNLGGALEHKGQIDEAIIHYRKTLDLPFDHGRAHYNLANALFHKGEIDEAITHYRQALELHPDHANTYNNLGNALRQKGLLAEAIAQYQKAAEIEPDSVLFQNNYAWMLATCSDATLRDGAKALAVAERADQLSGGKNPIVLHTLAAAYAESGRFPEALATAQRAVELADVQNNTLLRRSLKQEIDLYQMGTPYHER